MNRSSARPGSTDIGLVALTRSSTPSGRARPLRKRTDHRLVAAPAAGGRPRESTCPWTASTIRKRTFATPRVRGSRGQPGRAVERRPRAVTLHGKRAQGVAQLAHGRGRADAVADTSPIITAVRSRSSSSASYQRRRSGAPGRWAGSGRPAQGADGAAGGRGAGCAGGSRPAGARSEALDVVDGERHPFGGEREQSRSSPSKRSSAAAPRTNQPQPLAEVTSGTTIRRRSARRSPRRRRPGRPRSAGSPSPTSCAAARTTSSRPHVPSPSITRLTGVTGQHDARSERPDPGASSSAQQQAGGVGLEQSRPARPARRSARPSPGGRAPRRRCSGACARSATPSASARAPAPRTCSARARLSSTNTATLVRSTSGSNGLMT